MGVIDEIKAQYSIFDVIGMLGLEVRRATCVCPTGCRTRGKEDRRLPVLLKPGNKWQCLACGAHGDQVDMMSYAKTGRGYKGEGQLKEWFNVASSEFPKREHEPIVEKPYPPRRDLLKLWSDAGPADPETILWLKERLGSQHLQLALGYVRSLSPKSRYNWTSGYDGQWYDAGYRVLIPLFDSCANMVSIRARRLTLDKAVSGPKSQGPKGCRISGSVMMNRWALQMMRGAPAPRLIITEGEPAWLAWCTQTRDPVIGIGSGWWDQSIADQIPYNTKILLAVDTDTAGDKYAKNIISTLKNHSIKRVTR